MIVLRRFLMLIALFFWQGGFTFYASVVVPIGQEVFGSLRQGFLTRQVTVYLNLAGAVALVVLVWDLLAARDLLKWRRRVRWLLWITMMLTLMWLIQLHGQLDQHLVAKGYLVREADTFRQGHRLYLWIHTVQWACALLYLVVTLAIWRTEDGLQGSVKETEGAKKVPPLAPSASPSHRSSHTAEQELS